MDRPTQPSSPVRLQAGVHALAGYRVRGVLKNGCTLSAMKKPKNMRLTIRLDRDTLDRL